MLIKLDRLCGMDWMDSNKDKDSVSLQNGESGVSSPVNTPSNQSELGGNWREHWDPDIKITEWSLKEF